MPIYWGQQIFAHGRFPEVGQKQKTESEKKRRLNDGNNNGQAMHGARRPAWGTQAVWANLLQKTASRFLQWQANSYNH